MTLGQELPYVLLTQLLQNRVIDTCRDRRHDISRCRKAISGIFTHAEESVPGPIKVLNSDPERKLRRVSREIFWTGVQRKAQLVKKSAEIRILGSSP
jgi:hypothetical protein